MIKRAPLIIAHRLSILKRTYKIVVFENSRLAQVEKQDELYKEEDGLHYKLVDLLLNNQKESYGT